MKLLMHVICSAVLADYTAIFSNSALKRVMCQYVLISKFNVFLCFDLSMLTRIHIIVRGRMSHQYNMNYIVFARARKSLFGCSALKGL